MKYRDGFFLFVGMILGVVLFYLGLLFSLSLLTPKILDSINIENVNLDLNETEFVRVLNETIDYRTNERSKLNYIDWEDQDLSEWDSCSYYIKSDETCCLNIINASENIINKSCWIGREQ